MKKLSETERLKLIIKKQQKIIRILSSKEIVKGLKSTLERIERGDYVNEKDFFKDSPLITA